MKKKYKITILLIGIFFTISLMIGLSYAYYIFSVSQSGTNVVRSDCFEITYLDGDAINLSNTISLTDEEAKELDPYTFTIKNVCNSVMEYDINIETLNNSTIDLNAVAVRLDNRKKKILGEVANNDSSQIVNNNASSSKTIYNNILKPNEEKGFNLRIWIDEDATVEQSANKSFSSKVVVSTKMMTNYSEATLISGPLFNKAIKQLAGDEITQEDLVYYNDEINDENFASWGYPNDYNEYNEYVSDENIVNFTFSNQAPPVNANTVVVSTPTSDKEIVAWFDTDTIYLYSEAEKLYLNQNSALLLACLENLENLDLSSFDTSNVTNMYSMFYDMSTLTNLNLSSFDTSNVINMSGMFNCMFSLTSLDLSSFDTSKVTDMSWMFAEMNSLIGLDLSNFDTSNITNMSGMFQDMYSLTSLNLSSFDTSKVTDMSRVFFGMTDLTNIDLSSFNTSKVTNMSWMFNEMNDLATIYVSDNFDISSVTESENIFNNNTQLVGGSNTTYSSSNNTVDYAKIDCAPSSPGYFTYKGPLGDTAAYCASLN